MWKQSITWQNIVASYHMSCMTFPHVMQGEMYMLINLKLTVLVPGKSKSSSNV